MKGWKRQWCSNGTGCDDSQDNNDSESGDDGDGGFDAGCDGFIEYLLTASDDGCDAGSGDTFVDSLDLSDNDDDDSGKETVVMIPVFVLLFSCSVLCDTDINDNNDEDADVGADSLASFFLYSYFLASL